MTYTLNNRKLLTKKQAEAVIRHLQADMSYGEGGSFNRESGKSGKYVIDFRDMELVKEAIRRIQSYLTQD